MRETTKVLVPPAEPPTAEEIERRRSVVKRILALRRKIDIPVSELLREARGEAS